MLAVDFLTLFRVFAASFGLCVALVVCARLWPRHFARAQDLAAVQAAHHRPTARVGGVGIILALALAFVLADPGEGLLIVLLATLLPVFLVGLAEDLGLAVSPRLRLLAAAVSSGLAVLLLQVWLVRADLPVLDPLLAIPLLAIPVTLAWGAGMCHAFNLIDGVNGLSSGNAALGALGLSVIAHLAGQDDIALAALLLVPAILGFLALNWPGGKLFLGDAGAYSLGHLLVWLSILLLVRAPEVSAPALIGLFFWPLADTLLAIYRRWRAGLRHDQADRLHFHQLVMRGLEIGLIGRGRRHVSNPATAALLLPVIGLGIWGHVLLWQTPWAGYLLLTAQGLGFVLLYLGGMRFFSVRRRPLRFRSALPEPAELKQAE